MHTFSRLFLATALACTVLLAGGCGPKQVSPYAGGAGAGSDDSMGGNRMGNITEETGPGVEGLDSTGRGGSGSLATDADQQSDAYKRAHGRSSPEFTPIYFDYDHSGIRSDQIPSMEHNGGYLKSNS